MSDTPRCYHPGDLARITSPDCEGCGECCRGMEDTVVLDPYDSYQLSCGLGRPFADLLNNEVGLHVENGILLPHIAMRGTHSACSFLDKNGRCSIHSFRPGVCRLYPMARLYTPKGIRYFISPNACPGHVRSKARIRSYLQIENYDDYETFKTEWHLFLKDVQDRVMDMGEADREKVSLFILETFFLRPYDGGGFYGVVGRRIFRARKGILR